MAKKLQSGLKLVLSFTALFLEIETAESHQLLFSSEVKCTKYLFTVKKPRSLLSATATTSFNEK